MPVFWQHVFSLEPITSFRVLGLHFIQKEAFGANGTRPVSFFGETMSRNKVIARLLTFFTGQLFTEDHVKSHTQLLRDHFRGSGPERIKNTALWSQLDGAYKDQTMSTLTTGRQPARREGDESSAPNLSLHPLLAFLLGIEGYGGDMASALQQSYLDVASRRPPPGCLQGPKSHPGLKNAKASGAVEESSHPSGSRALPDIRKMVTRSLALNPTRPTPYMDRVNQKKGKGTASASALPRSHLQVTISPSSSGSSEEPKQVLDMQKANVTRATREAMLAGSRSSPTVPVVVVRSAEVPVERALSAGSDALPPQEPALSVTPPVAYGDILNPPDPAETIEDFIQGLSYGESPQTAADGANNHSPAA